MLLTVDYIIVDSNKELFNC